MEFQEGNSLLSYQKASKSQKEGSTFRSKGYEQPQSIGKLQDPDDSEELMESVRKITESMEQQVRILNSQRANEDSLNYCNHPMQSSFDREYPKVLNEFQPNLDMSYASLASRGGRSSRNKNEVLERRESFAQRNLGDVFSSQEEKMIELNSFMRKKSETSNSFGSLMNEDFKDFRKYNKTVSGRNFIDRLAVLENTIEEKMKENFERITDSVLRVHSEPKEKIIEVHLGPTKILDNRKTFYNSFEERKYRTEENLKSMEGFGSDLKMGSGSQQIIEKKSVQTVDTFQGEENLLASPSALSELNLISSAGFQKSTEKKELISRQKVDEKQQIDALPRQIKETKKNLPKAIEDDLEYSIDFLTSTRKHEDNANYIGSSRYIRSDRSEGLTKLEVSVVEFLRQGNIRAACETLKKLQTFILGSGETSLVHLSYTFYLACECALRLGDVKTFIINCQKTLDLTKDDNFIMLKDTQKKTVMAYLIDIYSKRILIEFQQEKLMPSEAQDIFSDYVQFIKQTKLLFEYSYFIVNCHKAYTVYISYLQERKLYNDCLIICKELDSLLSTDDIERKAIVYHTIGTLYLALKFLRKAEEAFEVSLNLIDKIPSNRREEEELVKVQISLIDHLSCLKLERKDHINALDLLIRCYNLKRTCSGYDSENIATTLVAIARVYKILGRWDDAIEYFTRGADSFERLKGPNNIHTANAFIELAQIRAFQGIYKKAIDLTESALTIYINLNGKDHSSTLRLYTNLIFLSLKLNSNEMIRYYIELISDILNEKEDEISFVLFNEIGNLLRQHKRQQDAITFYQKSKEIFNKLPQKQTKLDQLSVVYCNIANCYLELDNKNEYIEHTKRAVSILNSVYEENDQRIQTLYGKLYQTLSSVNSSEAAFFKQKLMVSH